MQAQAATLPSSRATGTSSSIGTSIGMIDLGHIDELARRLSGLVPPGLRESRDELQQNFKSVLQTGLAKLDLVTREEFEVQRAVLLRTREKLEQLQQAVAELEAQVEGRAAAAPVPDTDTPLPRH